MRKILLSIIFLATFALPISVASAQVFSQSQVINAPYGVGVVISSSTANSGHLQAIATSSLGISTTNVVEGTKLFFTNARAIAATLTGYVSGAGTISSSDTILSAIQKLNGNIGALVTGVSSVFGRTGAVTAQSGDYTTAQVTESGNLYFTNARARSALSGTYPIVYDSTNGIFSTAFGTTTSNTFAGTQTFTNSPVFSTLGAGTVNSTSGGSLYSSATSSVSSGTGISFTGTAGALIGGSSLTITNSGVTSLIAGTNITLSGATGAVTVNSTASGSGNGTIATSALETAGQVAVFSTTSGYPAKQYSVATSTPTVTGPITYSGTLGSFVGGISGTFGCTTASSGVTGCLSGTDWTTFNGKQAAGNYLTALTGDGTASGPGSAAFTLATVNGNVGSFTNANVTANAKGQITAISNGTAPTTYTGTYPIVVTGSVISTPLATTTIQQTYGTPQIGQITLATTSVSFNGLTVADSISNSGGIFTITPLWSGTLNNAGLTNSTISGVALGGSLFSHTHDATLSGTSYNGSAAVSDWGLNLTNVNSWTGRQNFANATTTLLTAGVTWFTSNTGAILSTSAGGLLQNTTVSSPLSFSGSTLSCPTCGTGTVTSVSGTTNQITSSGGTTPVLSLPNLVLFPLDASTTQLSVFNTAYFGGTSTSTINSAGLFTGNASTTALTASVFYDVNVTSALALFDSNKKEGAYAGTTCTNQFVRSLNGAGVATCASVANTDLVNSSISFSSSDGSLTVPASIALGSSGSFTLNLGNANTWTGIQTFTNGIVNNATSTGSKGFNISGGCFAISGTCIGGSGGGSGTVTSVAVSGGTTGLTTSGGPITTSGTITLAGTLGISNGGTNAIAASGAVSNIGAATTTDVQIFTTPGSNTWTKPTGAKSVHIEMIGGAGGAGAGRKGATGVIRSAGSGGGAGSYGQITLPAAALGLTETVTVGSGGTGAISQTTNDTNGGNGADGTRSSFGLWLSVGSGAGGAGGTTGGSSGGTGSTGFPNAAPFNGGAGSSGSSSGGAGTGASSGNFAPTGGGSGGGILSTNVAENGGAGGSIGATGIVNTSYGTTIAGGTAGNAAGTLAGGNGNTIAANVAIGGTGGGGGASSLSVNGGNGGNGGLYGGGGGGGGSSVDSLGNSGSGGNGGSGIVIVTTTF